MKTRKTFAIDGDSLKGTIMFSLLNRPGKVVVGVYWPAGIDLIPTVIEGTFDEVKRRCDAIKEKYGLVEIL